MIRTDIRLATASLKSAKLRAFLTMVAIIVGVTGFMLVTTFVDGFKRNITDQVNSLGTNLIQITPGNSLIRDEEGNIIGFDPIASFGASTLTAADLEDIRATEGVEMVAPLMMISGLVQRGNEALSGVSIMATSHQYPDTFGQKLGSGSFFGKNDSDKKFVVIGSSIAEELYASETAGVGTQLTIRGEKFTIVGIMEKWDMGMSMFFDLNKIVIIPLGTATAFSQGAMNIMEVDIRINENSDVQAMAASLNVALLENHGGEQDFTVSTQEEMLRLTEDMISQLKIVSQAMTFIMLFVGGVVITLIMLITVKERTREIGIRKSIGATNGSILTQFLVEALVISWIGSLIGVGVSFLIGLYLGAVTDIMPAYTIPTIVAVIIISTLVGGFAGLAPAFIAARKDPVEALRDE